MNVVSYTTKCIMNNHAQNDLRGLCVSFILHKKIRISPYPDNVIDHAQYELMHLSNGVSCVEQNVSKKDIF